MPELEFRRGIVEALDEELARDDRVIFFGEDVALPGGVFAATPGLVEKHGGDRVFDTPISELAITGAAFGSAVAGLRPVIEIMFGDFLPLAMDGLVNQAAKYWYLSNEQAAVPLVVRSAVGGGGRFGAIHSQMPAPWFNGVPGLKIVAPSDAVTAKGLLKAAIRDDNPVLFLEHKRLYSQKTSVDDPQVGPLPIGKAELVRAGRDLTFVAAMQDVAKALSAADVLASEHGIEAEVIDLRTIRPFDRDLVLASVARTNHLVVLEEGPRTGGWAGEVLTVVVEEALEEIDDAWRIVTRDQPIPYSPPLEDSFFPGVDEIVRRVIERLGVR